MILVATVIYLGATSLFVLSLMLSAARPMPKPDKVCTAETTGDRRWQLSSCSVEAVRLLTARSATTNEDIC